MKKVLLIDDNKKFCQSVSELLQHEGFQVCLAYDGTEGIQKALTLSPDIILCDVVIPKMSGHQVFKTLQKIPHTSVVPFIFITGKNERLDNREAMQLGADDYITKPIDPKELIIILNTRLEKHEKIMSAYDEKFKALINSPLTGVGIIQNNRFIFANQKLLGLLCVSKENLQWKKINEFIHPDDYDLVKKELMLCTRGIREEFRLDTRLVRNTRSVIPVKIFAKSISGQGSDKKFLVNIAKKHHAKFQPGTSKNPASIHITPREIEILQYICEGYNSHEIAEKLNISIKTVNGHRANLLSKTGTKNSISLVIYAIRNHLYDIC